MIPIRLPLQVADRWRDFALLEGGDGMKKERWGQTLLVRPDPQIIWPRRRPGPWTGVDAIYHRSTAGGGQWKYERSLPESWTIRYDQLTFRIRPTGFKHTGLFPEQAANWDWFGAKIRAAGRPVSVLNLFGYTGGATVAAAAAGATVCHVDAAKGMVQWCRENAALSGLEAAPIRYIVDDCLKFVRREAQRGRKYDAIMMDPPSYGRGKEGEMWKLERDLWPLLEACREILSDRPLFFLVNSYTTGLSPTVLGNLLGDLMTRHPGQLSAGELALPFQDEPGRLLPCGLFARWEA